MHVCVCLPLELLIYTRRCCFIICFTVLCCALDGDVSTRAGAYTLTQPTSTVAISTTSKYAGLFFACSV